MKIAIVKLSALGDIVHAMVVLQFIKKYNQAIEIDWIVEDCYKELLEYNPYVNKIHSVNLKEVKKEKSCYMLFSEFRKIRKFGQYDLVIDMQGLIKSALISWLIPSKLTLGFDKSSAKESLSSIFYNKTFKISYNKNVVERNFELIKFALDLPFKNEEIQHKLPFLFHSKKYLTSNLSDVKKNIILIPGASNSSKRFPLEKFAELINLLDAKCHIVWGSQEEKIIAEKIKDLSPKVIICEKLSLDSLILLVSNVDFVIGSDTGPTHIAWALNIPSITLFGPTPGYRNTYITSINKIIESSSIVNPYKINKNDDSIKEISVAKILDLTNNMLNQSATN
jgi:heptosyltransferase I